MSETFTPVEGVAISANAFGDILEALAVRGDAETQGVFRGIGDELEVTGTSSPLAVGTGKAFVKEGLYENDTSINVDMPTPSADTRIDRIVLRLDYVASPWTCTVERLAGTEGSGAPPSLTQTEGTTWEISLAQVSITTAGAITVTDERSYCGDGQTVTASLADGAVTTDKIADDAVTDAKLRDSAGLSVIGRSANTAGDPADITATADGQVLRRSGTTLGFGQVATAGIADDAVTADKIVDNLDGQPIGLNADKVDGYHANDLLAGGIIKGGIIIWYGSLGGSDGHRPIVDGSPNEDWHLCNGETVNGVATPNLVNRFIVGAGGDYNRGDTGGEDASDLNHRHGAGSGGLTTQSGGSHRHGLSGAQSVSTGSYSAAIVPGNTDYATIPSLTVQGYTDYAGSAAQENRPRYRAVYFICKVA